MEPQKGLQTWSTDRFLTFLRSWFVGFAGDLAPLMLRAFYWCVGDLRDPKRRSSEWGGWPLEGLGELVRVVVKHFGELNIFMSFGFWLLSDGVSMPEDPGAMLYDRLFYDFDAQDRESGVEAALLFSSILTSKYGVVPLVVDSGIKGAHVYVFLSEPVGWEDFRVLWEHLLRQAPEGVRPLADRGVVSTHRRLARVPLTRNVKDGRNVATRIVHPRPMGLSDFSLEGVRPLDLTKVRVYKFRAEVGEVVRVGSDEKPPRAEIPWIERLIATGLPDGRKRALALIVVPYLANVLRLGSEEALRRARAFLDASCEHHGRCDEVPERALEYLVRRVREKGIRPIRREKLEENHRDLLALIQSSTEPNRTGPTRASPTGQDPTSSVLSAIDEFLRDTGLSEFSYEDFRRWLESKRGPLDAKGWHWWERRLRELAEAGLLGRRFLVDGRWVDYGGGRVERPPSREVRFYFLA